MICRSRFAPGRHCLNCRMLLPPTRRPAPAEAFRPVMFVTQGVLRGGQLGPPIQRAEAKLWQVIALAGRSD